MGTYLVHSLFTDKSLKRAFAGDFTILEEGGDRLQVQTREGLRELARSGDRWTDGTFTVTAAKKALHSHDMLIGQMTRSGADGLKDAFVAIELKPDPEFRDILVDGGETAYNFSFQSLGDETLKVARTPGSARTLTFQLPQSAGDATSLPGQPPGRFSAFTEDKKTGIFGFVLGHRIKHDGAYHRVLVGHIMTSSDGPDGTEDIEPYVAVSAHPGPVPCEEG